MQLLLGYRDQDNWFFRLDPRVKIIWLLGNLALAILLQKTWFLLFLLVLVLLTLKAAGISLRHFLPLLVFLGVVGSQIILLQGILIREGPILLDWGLKIYGGGLLRGLTGLLLLMDMALLCLQFTLWTAPEEMIQLLIKCRLPEKYAVLLGLALHFLPITEKDLTAIYESQQCRGLEMRTFWQKAKGLPPLIMPLILRSLQRAGEVTVVMELKGYTKSPGRTFLRRIALTGSDRTALLCLACFFAAALWLNLSF